MSSDATAKPPAATEVIRMMTWRFIRHGWATPLPALFVLCGLPTLLYAMVRWTDPLVATTLRDDASAIKRLYFLLVVGTVPPFVLFEAMRVRPLYTLPLTMRQIVNVQLGLSLLSVPMVYLAIAAYYRVVFAAPVPILTPLFFLMPALLIAGAIATLLVDARWWKIPVAICTAVVVGWYTVVRFTAEERLASTEWFTPTVSEIIVLSMAGCVSYVAIVHGGMKDRRGDTESWKHVEERLVREISRAASALRVRLDRREHASPVRAQLSVDWQTRGLILPIATSFLGLLSFFAAWDDPLPWFQGFTRSLPFLLIIGMSVNGYFVGLMDGPRIQGVMDRYRATRPLTDAQLAFTALRSGLRGTALSLVIVLLVAAAVSALALADGASLGSQWSILDGQPDSIFMPGLLNYLLVLAAAAMVGWAGLGFNTTCLATGRYWLVSSLFVAGVALMMTSIPVSRMLDPETAETIGQLSLGAASLLAVLLTGCCFAAAGSRGLITGANWIGGGLLWTGAAVLSLRVFPRPEHMPELFGPAVIGLASLAALPIASAPLAVWWNRHR